MPLNPLLPPPRHYGRRGRLLRYEWENRGTTASGKTRWYDTDTKKTRYQKSKPGTGRQKKQPDEGGGKKPAEKKPTAGKKPPTPRKPKVDHQAVGAQIEKMIDGGFSEQDVADLKEQLQGLTVAQLGELKKKFNLKGGGRTKADVAGRLGAHAEGGRKAPAGEQPPTPRPAPRKPPISFGPEDVDGILGEENPAPRRGALGDADAEREARIRAHTERVAAEEPKRAATGGGGRPRKTATRPAQAQLGVTPSAVPGTPEHPVPRLPEPPSVPAPPAREQRNRAGLGRAPTLPPRPKRPPQEPAPTPPRSVERAPGSRPSATTRNRLTSGVRKQMGPAPKPVRIGRGGQRLNARSPVAVILHARNPLAVRPLLYGWVRSASRSGKPVWVSDTNPRDRRYQENRPGGGRPGQHAPVGTVPIEEHLRRILEAPYDVADYYLTSLQGRLRRLKPAALEALKRQFPALEQ